MTNVRPSRSKQSHCQDHNVIQAINQIRYTSVSFVAERANWLGVASGGLASGGTEKRVKLPIKATVVK